MFTYNSKINFNVKYRFFTAIICRELRIYNQEEIHEKRNTRQIHDIILFINQLNYISIN
jgi:hypothetical protein